MMFAGIDYSITCPAITIGNSKDYTKCKSFFYIDSKKFEGKFGDNVYGMLALPYESQMQRIDNLSEWAMAIIRKFKVTQACIEGYSFASQSGRAFDLGENGGLLKYKLYKENVDFIIAPPKTLKKSFSGNGNANKLVMYESFLQKTNGIDLANLLNTNPEKNPISDIVDSYAALCYNFE